MVAAKLTIQAVIALVLALQFAVAWQNNEKISFIWGQSNLYGFTAFLVLFKAINLFPDNKQNLLTKLIYVFFARFKLGFVIYAITGQFNLAGFWKDFFHEYLVISLIYILVPLKYLLWLYRNNLTRTLICALSVQSASNAIVFVHSLFSFNSILALCCVSLAAFVNDYAFLLYRNKLRLQLRYADIENYGPFWVFGGFIQLGGWCMVFLTGNNFFVYLAVAFQHIFYQYWFCYGWMVAEGEALEQKKLE